MAAPVKVALHPPDEVACGRWRDAWSSLSTTTSPLLAAPNNGLLRRDSSRRPPPPTSRASAEELTSSSSSISLLVAPSSDPRRPPPPIDDAPSSLSASATGLPQLAVPQTVSLDRESGDGDAGGAADFFDETMFDGGSTIVVRSDKSESSNKEMADLLELQTAAAGEMLKHRRRRLMTIFNQPENLGTVQLESVVRARSETAWNRALGALLVEGADDGSGGCGVSCCCHDAGWIEWRGQRGCCARFLAGRRCPSLLAQHGVAHCFDASTSATHDEPRAAPTPRTWQQPVTAAADQSSDGACHRPATAGCAPRAPQWHRAWSAAPSRIAVAATALCHQPAAASYGSGKHQRGAQVTRGKKKMCSFT